MNSEYAKAEVQFHCLPSSATLINEHGVEGDHNSTSLFIAVKLYVYSDFSYIQCSLFFGRKLERKRRYETTSNHTL